MPDARAERAAVLRLAESCRYEAAHTMQVTRLALRLFDELRRLHGLGARDRELLEYAALLHDIGWVEGQPGHHKTALRLILGARDLPLSENDRVLVACVARYHRKALPSRRHEPFASLAKADRRTVRLLAAVLRVADGLDFTHRSVVRDLVCEVAAGEITVRCRAAAPAEEEQRKALQKGDLAEEVFQRRLVIAWVR